MIPVELKSGTSKVFHIGHHAQVLVYAVLLEERLRRQVEVPALGPFLCPQVHPQGGILTYLGEPPATMGVTREWRDVRGVIIERNRMARNLGQKSGLPPMKKDERYFKTFCFQTQFRYFGGLALRSREKFWP